jgi:hypothetical protein
VVGNVEQVVANAWDELLGTITGTELTRETLHQAREQMTRAMPTLEPIIPPLLPNVGLRPSAQLYNEITRRHDLEAKYFSGNEFIDEMENEEPFNPFKPPYTNQKPEVKPMKLTELTQALPMLGLRVMINPEFNHEYSRDVQGVTGTITSLQGDSRSVYKRITEYKQKGKSTGWSVTVKFDNGKTGTIRIEKLLPVFGIDSVLHRVIFETGDEYMWTPDEYERKIDKYVIVNGYKVHKHEIFNDEYRQKLLDEH